MSETVRWTVKGDRVLGPVPFFIVGIINVTPDSFYDGGRWSDPDRAVSYGLKLAQSGADILDVGGESTRPFAESVEERREIDRVLPVLRGLAEKGKDGTILSIDTYKARVAAESLEAGARIVNDISACRFDPGLIDVLSEYRPGYVLMHSLGRPGDMQKNPSYTNVVEEVFSFLEERLTFLVRSGVPEDRIVLDPGIGFGKRLEHNLALLRNLRRFSELGRPVYLGLSNKSLWQDLLGVTIENREHATQVATALAARQGVRIHRVHNVQQTRRTLTIVQALAE